MFKNFFIVLSQPRTGSSDFIQRLDSYEGINCFGELFHHKNDHLDHEKAKKHPLVLSFIEKPLDLKQIKQLHLIS